MLRYSDKKEKGFTLVELALVVAIVAILAILAIPRYRNYQCKAKQNEARQGLGTIAKLEEAHFAVHDTYEKDPKVIGFTNAEGEVGMRGKSYYEYVITDADDTTFIATATANFFGKPDEWTIDHTLTLVNTQNGCN